MKRLGDYIKLIGGGTPSKSIDSFWGGSIPWMSVKDLKSDVINTTEDYITSEGVQNSATNIVPPGSLIIATRMAVGKPVITEIETAINQDLKAIQITGDIDKLYLFYILKSNQRYFERMSSGATVKGIKIGVLTDLKIPLPPLPTQQKIAAILDAADQLRQLNKQLITKYDELAQSLFLDMFGDPVTNPKGWETKKVKEIAKLKAGKFIAASEIKKQDCKGVFPCFGGNGLRGFVRSYTHEGEFVLIGRQGALCGNVKIANGVFHATEHAIVCSPLRELKTTWLFYLFERMNLNQYSTGAAQPGLNVSTVNELDIIFPPFEIQNQFAQRISEIESQKSQAQSSLEKSEELFNSLLQKAFRGELVGE